MCDIANAELAGECRTGQQWSEWRRLRFVFQNFEGMEQRRVTSPVLECHGCEWSLVLFPRGDSSCSSSNDDETVSLFLRCASFIKRDGPDKVTAEYAFRIVSYNFLFDNRLRNTFSSEAGSGLTQWRTRRDLLNPRKFLIENGDLVIEVGIRVLRDDSAMKSIEWSPTNTVCRDMLRMLEDATEDEDAKLIFEVGQGTAPPGFGRFRAHRNILKSRSPVLAALIEDCSDETTTIPIEDVEPKIFQMLLRFIYGGEIPEKAILKENARSIISAADRFGCTGLKLAAETELAVRASLTSGITVDNAAELLLFADGTNCAMLKEAVMEFFADYSADVMQSDGFAKVQESNEIMKELMDETLGSSKKRKAHSESASGSKDFKRMRVAELRQKLDEKGLDVDGSKELLIARLEEAEIVVVE